MTKKTKCEHKGRHEYILVYESATSRISSCACGKIVKEDKDE